MHSITLNDVKYGLDKGFVEVINNICDGMISARIGDMYFYFENDPEYESLGVDEYLKVRPVSVIAQDIYEALSAFEEDAQNEDSAYKEEWEYYRLVFDKKLPCRMLAATTEGQDYLYHCRCRSCQFFHRCSYIN